MKIKPHLQFRGQCKEAFELYRRILGGKLFMMSHAESPTAGDVPVDWRDKIVHATLTVRDTELAGADVRPGQYQRPLGFSVLVSVPDDKEGARVFASLSPGGQIQLPFQETFWSSGFGALVDRFGTPWEVTVDPRAG